MKKFIFILVLISTISAAYSQYPPCMPYRGYTFCTEQLSEFPPYSTDMPYEVLIGYIALDTVGYYGTLNDLHQFFGRQTTYNDTLKTIMKYYYHTVDYNPVLYHRADLFYDTNMVISPGCIARYIFEAVENYSPAPMLDYVLLRSKIIAHIQVTDTIPVIDTTASGCAAFLYNVKCTIIDTIKGNIIPFCDKDEEDTNTTTTLIPALPDSTLQFIYCPFWTRKVGNSTKYLYDDDGLPWIKEGKEYIIFMDIIIICEEGDESYYTVRPVWPESSTFLMFPIIDNKVYNPGDDFGFGDGLSPSIFKSKLRARIDSIRYYNPQ